MAFGGSQHIMFRLSLQHTNTRDGGQFKSEDYKNTSAFVQSNSSNQKCCTKQTAQHKTQSIKCALKIKCLKHNQV